MASHARIEGTDMVEVVWNVDSPGRPNRRRVSKNIEAKERPEFGECSKLVGGEGDAKTG